MKLFKKSVIQTLTLISALTLGACSNNDSIDLELENADGGFITTNLINVSNQEAFEAMVTSFDNQSGVNNGVLYLLDLVDFDLLNGSVEIDESEIDEAIERYREAADDYESFLIAAGFQSEDELVDYLRLLSLRNEAVRRAVEITDEEIEDAYNLIYGLDEDEDADTDDDADTDEDADTDDDADTDEDADNEDEDEEEEEIPTLEEAWDDIEENLIRQQLTQSFVQTELARLRNEAGFTISDSYLQDQYIEFLEIVGVTEDVYSKSSRTDKNIVATVGEIEYNANQLFEILMTNVGLATGIELVDPAILGAEFEVDESEVTEAMDGLKIELGEQFYPNFHRLGYKNDQEIFDYLTLVQLQEIAFEEAHTPSEERLEELYAEYLEATADNISARHILVADEDLAKELIAELEEADDVEALFAELAQEHSTCDSSSVGGDLGSFDPDRMVEEFSEAALELDVATFTAEPVETEYGFHIIYRYENGAAPTFEELREDLFTQELSRLRTDERREAILVEHREAANFAFENERLQTRYDVIVENIYEALDKSEATD